MFKFLQRKRKRDSLPKAPGDDFAPPSPSSSSSSDDDDDLPVEADASSEEEEEDGDSEEEDEDEEEGSVSTGTVRVPRSLFAALEDPVVPLGGAGLTQDDDDESDSDASAAADDDDDDDGEGEDGGVMECLMCPGKKLKTPQIVTEHLSSQAHKRRRKRFEAYITAPPQEGGSLSPDPRDIVAILDTSITALAERAKGSAPSPTKKRLEQRKRRRRMRLKQRRKAAGEDGKAEPGRVRKGKRERKELAELKAKADDGKPGKKPRVGPS